MTEELEEYLLSHIDKEPALLAKLNRETHIKIINPRMLSGHLQGRILAMFCRMIKPKSILELGTFTGYATLCLAEHLPDDGVLHTIEVDDELEDIITKYTAPYADKIRLHFGEALQIIPTLTETFDLVFIDADKRDYSAYYEAVFDRVAQGGFIIADNTLWDGKVLETNTPVNDLQTLAIKRFNDMIANDERIEKVILPIRDGLTVMMKK
ncbi:MAG: O-methyltransferase [Prevotellaceae bacterium]|jgi:predicted O-methyltransferase YrrM|nr:O-methyltransferase [Prevotellaceae bacterium]